MQREARPPGATGVPGFSKNQNAADYRRFDPIFQRWCRNLHRLGERPLAHFLASILAFADDETAAQILAALEQTAAVSPGAIDLLGLRHLSLPELHVLEGGQP